MPEAKRELAGIIFDMDEDVCAVVGLAKAIVRLGESASLLDPDAVFAVGEALESRATAVKKAWERAHALSRPGASS